MIGKFLGIDYGDARIGLAISDPMQIISTPFLVLQNTGIKNSLFRLKEIVQENDIKKIIMGLPLDQNAEDTEKSLQIREFTKKLQRKIQIPIEFYNESFTSFEANNELKRLGYNSKESKLVIDKIAASIILKNYLDENN